MFKTLWNAIMGKRGLKSGPDSTLNKPVYPESLLSTPLSTMEGGNSLFEDPDRAERRMTYTERGY